MADRYILRVTAGSNYDLDEHVEVPVNTPKAVHIRNDRMDVELIVRVRNYRGLPRDSPTSSPYFDEAPHDYNQDQYSIAFRFTPKRPPGVENGKPATPASDSAEGEADLDRTEGISATDMQFGNDLDHPIRDRLPPGFGTAMNIAKWWIDPGLEGDAYADSPYLYGPALSSFNTVHIGPGSFDAEQVGLRFEEGGDEEGLQARRELGVPDDSKGRMKWALKAENKERWVWEYGRTYGVDFFNPYLDFSEFALRLPGFTLPVMNYWDGQGLR
jgi:hypothetical protein